jgi:signal transduction histidine kinase
MRDSGPGVSDEIVDVINQNDPTVQTGIGIGLTLCREICNLSGLKMTFENLRPGLRVLVDLPVSRDLQEKYERV